MQNYTLTTQIIQNNTLTAQMVQHIDSMTQYTGLHNYTI